MECAHENHLDIIKRLKCANGQIKKITSMLEKEDNECINIAPLEK